MAGSAPSIPPTLEVVTLFHAPSPAPPLAFDLAQTPEQVIESWPREVPLAAFGLGAVSRWSRWAVLALPARTVRCHEGELPDAILSEIFGARRALATDDGPPFRGGWIGWLGYELGAQLEPKARLAKGALSDRAWPTLVFHRCDVAWCYDKLERRWWMTGPKRREMPRGSSNSEEVGHGPLTSMLHPPAEARTRYERAVARAREYIRAGDIYQVNLAHRMTTAFEGDPLALAPGFVRASEPWFGAWIADEHGGKRGAVLSASPELLFRFDAATRTITTRPMKGTRPAGESSALEASLKDRAELAMIVDLMRNDLGRVCAFGSVSVDEPRVIESHGRGHVGVLQAVSSVSGRLRESMTLEDVIRAIFPGGSITGAPKVRAMQIIEELDEAARGPYCGAIGYVSDSGDACFSVAIRTLAISGQAGENGTITRGVADYWVGAGIVADSEPAAEWEETLVKASPIRAAFGA